MSLRFRRHFKLVMALALVAVVLILGMGDQRIVAYTLQGSEEPPELADSLTNDLVPLGDALADNSQVLISGTDWLELVAH